MHNAHILAGSNARADRYSCAHARRNRSPKKGDVSVREMMQRHLDCDGKGQWVAHIDAIAMLFSDKHAAHENARRMV